MSKTDKFLQSIRAVSTNDIPDEVTSRVRQALLDYVGVTLAGRKAQEDKLKNLLDDMSEPSGNIYPIGIDTAVGVNDAAFLNGLNGHALDYDDGTNAGIIHLGSPIFSALLALMQRYPISEEAFIKASILGYETAFTMARSIQPRAKKRGYHATGVCGILGVTVALSYALGFTDKQIKDAFSIAAVSATGSLKVLEDGSDLKPYNVAKTAMLGMIAVEMTRAGFVGADDCLSGIAGYLTQIAGTDEIKFVEPMLDGTYAVQKAYIKPYAACRYCHPSIDIALDMHNKGMLSVDEIESVHIDTYDLAVKKHDHTDIRGKASAKMSIPYNFAVTYLTGRTGMDAFSDDSINSNAVMQLTKKVVVEENDVMTKLFPGLTIAEVKLTTTDGRVFCGRSELPKGEPENPLSQAEAEAKFKNLVNYAGYSDDYAQSVIDTVMIPGKLQSLMDILKREK